MKGSGGRCFEGLGLAVRVLDVGLGTLSLRHGGGVLHGMSLVTLPALLIPLWLNHVQVNRTHRAGLIC